MIPENRLSQISTLNQIYRRVLGRDADKSGIASYLGLLSDPNGAEKIAKILASSTEYLNKKNRKYNSEFNSLTGDRSSYTKSNDTSKIDSSVYASIVNSIIRLMIYIDNPEYPNADLAKRISDIKRSLIHIAENKLNFTVFPHLEQHFNSDKFNTSLLNTDNFRYFVLFTALLNIWKTIFDKTVATCGTKENIKNLSGDFITFDDLISLFKEFIVNYLSIRFLGRLLLAKERQQVFLYIHKHEYLNVVNFFIDNQKSLEQEENILVTANITALSDTLGRKPRVLLMIAYLETQNPKLIDHMLYNANKVRENNPLLDIDFALNNERVDRLSTDYTPWSRVKRIRNLMLDRYPIDNYDYLYIIDSDMIDYPHGFVSRAIGLNPKGITAPLALIQYSTVFYDWCGYQKPGATSIDGEYGDTILEKACTSRNFCLTPPYISNNNRLSQIDSVGCTYVVPTYIFKKTYGKIQSELIRIFDLAGVTDHKINENIVQYEDHPSFTDHYTICAAIRANGESVILDNGSVAYHADLPLYGENWH